jgi:cytochrome P450
MNVPASLNNKAYLEHRTIFREILDSKLPPHEKSLSRLAEDAAVTVAAGTLTTAWTLSVATYFLLSNPYILKRLKDELYAAFPEGSHMPLVEIEKLPYLGACIQEALRLSGATNRLTRIAPDETMVVRQGIYEWRIPPGTPTSMTIPLLQEDETIFPNPKTYRPERWIENPRLDKYLLSFGRGSRICAGINLAYAELYLAIGNLFRAYGSRECQHPSDRGVLELFDTCIRDVESVADKTIPGVWEGSKGIRLRVFDLAK